MGGLTASLGESDSLVNWELPLEDAPTGKTGKRAPAQAGKVSPASWEGCCCHTVVYAATQYGVKGWWLWATGKKFNNSKIPHAEREVEEKPSKQGPRQLYPISAWNAHFSQGTNFSHVYRLGEIQKWLNFEMWNLLFLNFLISRRVKAPFRKVLVKLVFSSRSGVLWGVTMSASRSPRPHLGLPRKIRTMRKNVYTLVYGLALIHRFSNTILPYIPIYKMNSPGFITAFYSPFF